MIINCECGKKKFNIDSSLIPKEGRLLKCGSCSKIWHYTPKIETKNAEELDIKINENVIKNEVQSNQAINDENFRDINEEVLSEENTDDDKDEEDNIKEVKRNEEKQGQIKMMLVYSIVVIISLLGLIFLLDTFKSHLISVFPSINTFFDSFYETLLDFKLFIKDLAS
tara:strand:- start:43 stop:546 length:504 start_codon:yes stop_codon:yes gene_type:complete